MILVMVLSAVLLILGITISSFVGQDVEQAGSVLRSADALYVADAGVNWGADVLGKAPFNLDTAGTTVDSVLTNVSLTLITDPTDPLNGCKELPSSPQTITLETIPATPFAPAVVRTGTFRVAIKDDNDNADPNDDTNDRFLLLSLGTASNGARRLIEASMSTK